MQMERIEPRKRATLQGEGGGYDWGPDSKIKVLNDELHQARVSVQECFGDVVAVFFKGLGFCCLRFCIFRSFSLRLVEFGKMSRDIYLIFLSFC